MNPRRPYPAGNHVATQNQLLGSLDWSVKDFEFRVQNFQVEVDAFRRGAPSEPLRTQFEGGDRVKKLVEP